MNDEQKSLFVTWQKRAGQSDKVMFALFVFMLIASISKHLPTSNAIGASIAITGIFFMYIIFRGGNRDV